MDELISVIIPVYKVEAYLEQCLDSVINQTYKNLEIILVDDGSPDKCGSICDKYAQRDLRIKVIHQNNLGLSEARNSGMDIMTGSYFAFVDSDDVINSRFIEILHSLLVKHNTDIAICDFSIFSEENVPIQFDDSKEPEITVMSEEQFAFRLLDDYTTPYSVVWNKLFRADKFGLLRFHKGMRFEDSLFLADYLVLGATCIYTNAKLYHYRKRSDSLAGKKDLEYILGSLEASIYQYNTLKKRYSITYRQNFYAGILKRISRLAADVYWNFNKKDAYKLRSKWLEFYYSDKQHIPNRKENEKILIYKYFPILYYYLVKKSLKSIISKTV